MLAGSLCARRATQTALLQRARNQCNAHNINDAPRLMHLGAFIRTSTVLTYVRMYVHVHLSRTRTVRTYVHAHVFCVTQDDAWEDVSWDSDPSASAVSAAPASPAGRSHTCTALATYVCTYISYVRTSATVELCMYTCTVCTYIVLQIRTLVIQTAPCSTFD